MLSDHFSQSGSNPPPAAKTCFKHMDRWTYRLMVITISVWYTALRATTRLKSAVRRILSTMPYVLCATCTAQITIKTFGWFINGKNVHRYWV